MRLPPAVLLVLVAGAAIPARSQPQQPNVVYAIVEGQLLTGVSQPSKVDDRGGVLLQGAAPGGLSCQVSYSYADGGQGRFTCSDGARFTVRYQGFSAFSGAGRGQFAGQTVSACYGLQPKDAMKHLAAPSGQKLAVEDGRLVLEPAA